LEPYLRFAIDKRDDVEATVLLVLIGLAVTEVALWGYRQQERAARQAGYLEGVLGAASAVADGDAPASSVVDVVAREIVQVLDADDCRYREGPVHDARVAVLAHDGELTRGGRRVDVDRAGLPTDEYVALPVRRGGVTTGHFLVTAASRTVYPSRERRRVAALLADQVAGAAAQSTES
jgi:GAF domain-containing protein